MSVRLVEPSDRNEWLRMLVTLYAGSTHEDHVPEVDAHLAGRVAGSPPHAAVFVYEREQGDGLAGFLELSVRNYAEGCAGETPYVESWYVDADVRGKGVGRALMAAAETWARAHGYREVASDTEVHNEASLQAHRALGFEEVERAIHLRKAL
jgi:aminoglycoside 6'-N-acetyltransferase I